MTDQYDLNEAEIALLRRMQPGEPMPHDPGQDQEARGNLIRRGFITPGDGTIVLSKAGERLKATLPA